MRIPTRVGAEPEVVLAAVAALVAPLPEFERVSVGFPGRGVEMVITLGTGFGTGLYVDGRVGPHLELAHHPFRKDETYEQQLGNAALERVGKRKWIRRASKAVDCLRALTLFDRPYIGGGNARHLAWDCPPGVSIVDNVAGLTGGIHADAAAAPSPRATSRPSIAS